MSTRPTPRQLARIVADRVAPLDFNQEARRVQTRWGTLRIWWYDDARVIAWIPRSAAYGLRSGALSHNVGRALGLGRIGLGSTLKIMGHR